MSDFGFWTLVSDIWILDTSVRFCIWTLESDFGWSSLKVIQNGYESVALLATNWIMFFLLKIEQQRLKFMSDRVVAQTELRKKLGQLLYLKNLVKVSFLIRFRGGSLKEKKVWLEWAKFQATYSKYLFALFSDPNQSWRKEPGTMSSLHQTARSPGK